MKRNAIIRIITWCLVLVVLMGVLCNVLYRDRLRYMGSATVETAIPVKLEETPVQMLSNEEELSIPASSIREIEIEWAAGDIVIMTKDVDSITVSESDVTDPKYSMVWNTKGETLEICFCEEMVGSALGIDFGGDISKDLYIYVPQDWACDSLEIDAAAANVEMQNLTIGELDFDGASGTCDLQNCNIQDLDIDTASGDVYYQGSLNTLDFDAASASFIGDLQNTPSRIDMDGMSGCLDIALPEDCGYTLSMDGLSSRLSSDFEGTSMKNGSHVFGDGRCHINVDGMSCDVTLRKLETIVAPTVDPTEETTHCTKDPCDDPTCTEHGHSAETCTNEACAVHGHTAENCTDETCTEHGHSAEDCSDVNCALHHTLENCADDNCTIHHSGKDSDHDSDHGNNHH